MPCGGYQFSVGHRTLHKLEMCLRQIAIEFQAAGPDLAKPTCARHHTPNESAERSGIAVPPSENFRISEFTMTKVWTISFQRFDTVGLGRQEGHPTCKKMSVGLLVVMI